MDLSLLLKAFIGFVIVLVIQLFARSKHYYIAALIPLFPSMALLSYYFVGQTQSADRLRETIIFGMISLVTYFSFLLALLISTKYLKIVPSLLLSSAVWFVVAFVQIQAWPYLKLLLGLRPLAD